MDGSHACAGIENSPDTVDADEGEFAKPYRL